MFDFPSIRLKESQSVTVGYGGTDTPYDAQGLVQLDVVVKTASFLFEKHASRMGWMNGWMEARGRKDWVEFRKVIPPLSLPPYDLNIPHSLSYSRHSIFHLYTLSSNQENIMDSLLLHLDLRHNASAPPLLLTEPLCNPLSCRKRECFILSLS